MPAGEVIAALMAVGVYRKVGAGIRFSPKLGRGLLISALPVASLQLIVAIYRRLDTLLLGWWAGPQAVGLYAVCYRVTEPLLLAPSVLAVSVYSAVASDPDNADLQHVSRRGLRLALLYALLMSLVVTVAAPVILNVVSPGHLQATPALRVLAWSLVFMSGNMILSVRLNAVGAFRVLLGIGVATLVTNVILNVVLIPPLGILGASIAVVVTEAANSLMQALAVRRKARARTEEINRDAHFVGLRRAKCAPGSR